MNVRRVTSMLALTSLGLLGAACDSVTEPIDGNGTVVRETRPSDRIDAVRVVNFARQLKGDCNIVTVHVSGNGEAVVSVEAESNLVPYIQTQVQNEVLRISLSAPLRPTQPVVISATRRGRSAESVTSSTPPFTMSGLGCSADMTVRLSSVQ